MGLEGYDIRCRGVCGVDAGSGNRQNRASRKTNEGHSRAVLIDSHHIARPPNVERTSRTIFDRKRVRWSDGSKGRVRHHLLQSAGDGLRIERSATFGGGHGDGIGGLLVIHQRNRALCRLIGDRDEEVVAAFPVDEKARVFDQCDEIVSSSIRLCQCEHAAHGPWTVHKVNTKGEFFRGIPFPAAVEIGIHSALGPRTEIKRAVPAFRNHVVVLVHKGIGCQRIGRSGRRLRLAEYFGEHHVQTVSRKNGSGADGDGKGGEDVLFHGAGVVAVCGD